MSRRSVILALTAGAVTFGCSAESQDHDKDTQEIIDNLVQAGFPADDITVVNGVVYEGRDAVVSLEASREMLEVSPSAASAGNKEHYRSNNLVSWAVRRICVDGTAYDDSYTLSTGLNNAIANYNALGVSFVMQRTGAHPTGCDAVIKVGLFSEQGPGPGPQNSVLGKSGYPSGGFPYPELNINTTTGSYGLGLTTWVLTHELGHTIGLRHSDYYNTSISCGGDNINEGASTSGVNWIPGSPPQAWAGGSIMTACPARGSGESGSFTVIDIFAIIALYGDVQFEIYGCCTNTAPAVSSWGPGRVDLFVRGYDWALWHQSVENGVVGAWESLGGYLLSAPAAVSWGFGRIDVFARGDDTTLQHVFFDNGSWSGWESLGGSLASAPAASSWGSGRLDIFGRGPNGDLQHLWFDNNLWAPWESLGGYGIAGDPAAVSWGPGRVDVFSMGWDNLLRHLWFDYNFWQPWESFPGYMTSSPTAASWAPGRLDLFATGPGNLLKRMTFDSNIWWGWADVGNAAFSTPAAVSWGYGRIDVFMLGWADDIWHKWFE